MTRRRTVLLGALSALTLTIGGCGGDDESGDSSSAEPATATTAAAPAAATGLGPEETMRAYFTAINAGDTKKICDLEDDTLEMFRYNATGDACLQNAANQNAQPAFANGDQITIVTQNVSGTTAAYAVKDQKGASISVGLEQVDGRWFMHVFT